MSELPARLRIDDSEELTRAINREIRKALRRHKLLGNPVYVGDGTGGVKKIMPEDLVIDESDLD